MRRMRALIAACAKQIPCMKHVSCTCVICACLGAQELIGVFIHAEKRFDACACPERSTKQVASLRMYAIGMRFALCADGLSVGGCETAL